MNCEMAQEQWVHLADGTLSAEDARAIRMHLASCSECSARLTPAQWVDILPTIDTPIEPSEDFARRFYAKLDARQTPWWRRISNWWTVRPMTAIGTMAAVLLAAVFVVRYPDYRADKAADLNDLEVAESLPLLEDMAVVSNLDLLEDFETIERLPNLIREGGAF